MEIQDIVKIVFDKLTKKYKSLIHLGDNKYLLLDEGDTEDEVKIKALIRECHEDLDEKVDSKNIE